MSSATRKTVRGRTRTVAKRARCVLLMLAGFLALLSQAPDRALQASPPAATAPAARWEAVFARIADGRQGCCLVVDASTGNLIFEANATRARQRFSPCSTFKLPLALMAFDRGTIGMGTRFKWDGRSHSFASWNHDQTVTTWMRESVVWVSQRITHMLGRGTIERYLGQFAYGNRDMSGGLDRAWLGESLEISAAEQVRFLARLWSGKLPLRPGVDRQVEGLLLRDVFPSGAVLLGKTGSGFRCLRDDQDRLLQDRQLGWFVGCVKRGNQTLVFAMNITDRQTREPAGRVTRGLAKRLLAQLGLL